MKKNKILSSIISLGLVSAVAVTAAALADNSLVAKSEPTVVPPDEIIAGATEPDKDGNKTSVIEMPKVEDGKKPVLDKDTIKALVDEKITTIEVKADGYSFEIPLVDSKGNAIAVSIDLVVDVFPATADTTKLVTEIAKEKSGQLAKVLEGKKALAIKPATDGKFGYTIKLKLDVATVAATELDFTNKTTKILHVENDGRVTSSTKFDVNADGSVTLSIDSGSSYVPADLAVVGSFNGDVNGDGKIDKADMILINRSQAKWKNQLKTTTDNNIYQNDINRDGVYNATDKILINQYMAGWKSAVAKFNPNNTTSPDTINLLPTYNPTKS